MAQIYNKMQIEVRTETQQDIITAVQNDAASRFLDVIITDNGTPIDLTGHEVRIYCKKFDGTECYNDGEITDAEVGRCQFELTDQMLAIAHDISVQITIYYENVEVLQAPFFTIHVVKSLMSDSAIESSNEYGALVVLYQNLYEAYDLMTAMIQQIGVPGAIAASISVETMWEAWEYIADVNQQALANSSVDGVMDLLGDSDDTSSDDTVFGGQAKALEKIGESETLISKVGSYCIYSDNAKVEVDEEWITTTVLNSSYVNGIIIGELMYRWIPPFSGTVKLEYTFYRDDARTSHYLSAAIVQMASCDENISTTTADLVVADIGTITAGTVYASSFSRVINTHYKSDETTEDVSLWVPVERGMPILVFMGNYSNANALGSVSNFKISYDVVEGGDDVC